jgi:hypothetical protein
VGMGRFGNSRIVIEHRRDQGGSVHWSRNEGQEAPGHMNKPLEVGSLRGTKEEEGLA